MNDSLLWALTVAVAALCAVLGWQLFNWLAGRGWWSGRGRGFGWFDRFSQAQQDADEAATARLDFYGWMREREREQGSIDRAKARAGIVDMGGDALPAPVVVQQEKPPTASVGTHDQSLAQDVRFSDGEVTKRMAAILANQHGSHMWTYQVRVFTANGPTRSVVVAVRASTLGQADSSVRGILDPLPEGVELELVLMRAMPVGHVDQPAT